MPVSCLQVMFLPDPIARCYGLQARGMRAQVCQTLAATSRRGQQLSHPDPQTAGTGAGIATLIPVCWYGCSLTDCIIPDR
jgi:hypothetical protein